MFKVSNQENQARSGEFKVINKAITTPFFMPVATKGAARHITSEELKQIGSKAIISNSLLLSLKPGREFINDFGGLHKFINYKDIIFTDSGGFQVIRDFCKQITKKSIHFKSPYDGKHHILTPKECMKNQVMIDSDVAMVLDHMPLADYTQEQINKSMETTFTWAKECKENHEELKSEYKSKQNLFGIVQGGTDEKLRKKSAEQITSIDFDGFALGGLAIGEAKPKMYKAFEIGLPLLPDNKLKYIMGLGHPADIIKAVEQGADCFDSIFPTQTARHNHILTENGFVKLLSSKYSTDKSPLDENCDCYVCKNYSKAFIRYMTKINEAVSYQLKSYHNLHFMQEFMEKIQTSIKEETFEELSKQYQKNY